MTFLFQQKRGIGSLTWIKVLLNPCLKLCRRKKRKKKKSLHGKDNQGFQLWEIIMSSVNLAKKSDIILLMAWKNASSFLQTIQSPMLSNLNMVSISILSQLLFLLVSETEEELLSDESDKQYFRSQYRRKQSNNNPKILTLS